MRRIALLVSLVLIAVGGPALAHNGLVSEKPANWTPHVLDGDVRAIAVVGDTVVVGGDFTRVADASKKQKFDRWFLFAFSLSTGKVLDFNPWLDGPVEALQAGPDNTVYVGGSFKRAGDRDQRGITQIDLTTSRPVDAFTASVDYGEVLTMGQSKGDIYLGGSFAHVNGAERKGLAKLDGKTGAVNKSFNPRLDAPEIGRVKVENIAISPSGDRLIAIGAMTQAAGDFRVQAAMFDLTRSEAVLTPWWTDAYNKSCRKGFDTYMRAVDFSPDGRYFVIVTTGRMNAENKLCDSAARFETYAGADAQPTWSNHTGGDSLYAVKVTENAIYVGGHQRWLNNPHGHESAGPGAVERPGIAAIDPGSGLAADWNPTRSRGVGVRAFALTSRGLLVGSDTDELAHEYHGKIGLFPN